MNYSIVRRGIVNDDIEGGGGLFKGQSNYVSSIRFTSVCGTEMRFTLLIRQSERLRMENFFSLPESMNFLSERRKGCAVMHGEIS